MPIHVPFCLFVLIGAQPFTGWLPETVRRDQWGFILTGPDTGQDWPLQRAPFLLETTTPGVFAAGDVPHGSMKRVVSAVGDGSTAIRLIHDYLALASSAHEGQESRLPATARYDQRPVLPLLARPACWMSRGRLAAGTCYQA
jgi:hypothetical protein